MVFRCLSSPVHSRTFITEDLLALTAFICASLFTVALARAHVSETRLRSVVCRISVVCPSRLYLVPLLGCLEKAAFGRCQIIELPPGPTAGSSLGGGFATGRAPFVPLVGLSPTPAAGPGRALGGRVLRQCTRNTHHW
jgi:hypothetical protein